jgi:phage gp46-like protein
VEELGLEELTDKQIEELCLKAEEAARKHILSKVPSKNIDTLNVIAEAEGAKPVSLKVEVDLELSQSARNIKVKQITDEAVKTAFASAKQYLRGLTCRSKK